MLTVSTSAALVSAEHQARQGRTCGAFELYLPELDNRVLFADDIDQVLGLLDTYLRVDELLERTVRELLAKPSLLEKGMSYWAARVSNEQGQVAWLAAGAQSRRLPRHFIGERVRFYLESESYLVGGLSLRFDRAQNTTSWYYHYSEGTGLGWGVSEQLTRYGATAGEQARLLATRLDRGERTYYKVVLAEQALFSVEAYTTRSAGPWYGLDRESFRDAVRAILPYAFAIREHRA